MSLQVLLSAALRQPTSTRKLSGWGRYPIVQGLVCRPEKMAALRAIAENGGEQTVLARGLGRSYGDAALNPDGITVLTERLNRLLSFDDETGILKAEAGVSLADLLATFVPRGWMLPVVPGTKFITLGGAVAADIHGKNHHIDGSFSRHVRSFELLCGRGRMSCSREFNADAFWATVGGMGLTGIVSDIELKLQKITSAYIGTKYVPAGNLDALMDAFAQHEADHQFSVAWIDCLAGGRRLGRGVLILGDFAEASELPAALSGAPLVWNEVKGRNIPLDMPHFMLNRVSIGLFNELFYRVHAPGKRLVHANKFFFPLDALHNWNRMYGKRGFVQYQCLLPPDASAEGLRRILGRCAEQGYGSFLAVLKRFGNREDTGGQPTLSFPYPGYTLALDFAVRDNLFPFLRELDRIVLDCGGRLYLAKDACMDEHTFKQMYPQWEDWLAVRSKLDPHRAFSSALSQRLGLDKR